jgi:non-ribosomal peptide synthetase component F
MEPSECRHAPAATATAGQTTIATDEKPRVSSFLDRASLDAMFAGQARRQPDAIAVSFENRQLTYRELDEAATALAQRLAHAGVVPGTLIALCFERSMAMIVAMLGVLKSGGA